MEQELKRYLIDKCRDWMLHEEVEALDQITLPPPEQDSAKHSLLAYQSFVIIHGINCKRMEQLMLPEKEKLEDSIATRLWNEHRDTLNHCPVGGRLARIPKNKKCRRCEHRWLEIANIMVTL